ncbi:MAG: hypothetical protein FWD33_02275 [Alphaproteobacteria bacterium]|nr:hypothetical protein [Alphaproteobacteria bacterium]
MIKFSNIFISLVFVAAVQLVSSSVSANTASQADIDALRALLSREDVTGDQVHKALGLPRRSSYGNCSIDRFTETIARAMNNESTNELDQSFILPYFHREFDRCQDFLMTLNGRVFGSRENLEVNVDWDNIRAEIAVQRMLESPVLLICQVKTQFLSDGWRFAFKAVDYALWGWVIYSGAVTIWKGGVGAVPAQAAAVTAKRSLTKAVMKAAVKQKGKSAATGAWKGVDANLMAEISRYSSQMMNHSRRSPIYIRNKNLLEQALLKLDSHVLRGLIMRSAIKGKVKLAVGGDYFTNLITWASQSLGGDVRAILASELSDEEFKFHTMAELGCQPLVERNNTNRCYKVCEKNMNFSQLYADRIDALNTALRGIVFGNNQEKRGCFDKETFALREFVSSRTRGDDAPIISFGFNQVESVRRNLEALAKKTECQLKSEIGEDVDIRLIIAFQKISSVDFKRDPSSFMILAGIEPITIRAGHLYRTSDFLLPAPVSHFSR